MSCIVIRFHYIIWKFKHLSGTLNFFFTMFRVYFLSEIQPGVTLQRRCGGV